jgi:hypothetical protein
MSYQLRYLYTRGERFSYAVTSHTAISDPNAEDGGKKAEEVDLFWRAYHEVTDVTGDIYAFKMFIKGDSGKSSPSCAYSHDKQGVVLFEPKDVVGYQSPIRLPNEPVEIGDSWEEDGVVFTVHAFEPDGSDLIVIITVACDLDLSAEGGAGRMESGIRFSTEKGRIASIRSITRLSFESGREVSSATDSHLEANV